TVPAGRTELAAIVDLVDEVEPLEVIVGLPRSLSGGEGPAAVKNRQRAQALARRLAQREPPVPVRLVDERLTTVTASRQLRESGRRVKDQRQVIDAAAAVTILEHALAAERARGEAPGELVSAADLPDQPAPSAGGNDRQSGETQ
ncbi:MAG: Holliday junction resolvase RuvX, partial [Propionibacteriaceae bacterium]